MDFVEVQFPTDVSYGSSGGPEFSTDIVITHGGQEKRNINWSAARAKYNISYGIKAQAQLDSVIAFFRARKGKAVGFRFKDWSDYKATGEIIGTGDGAKTQFQLTKTYTSGAGAEIRNITKPVSGTEKIYIDSVLQASGFSIDTTTGVVTFSTPPASAEVISADFEFDVPVRFDTDRLSSTLDSYGENSVKEIDLVEVRV